MQRGALVFAFLALVSGGVAADSKPDPKAKARAAELAMQSANHYKRGEFEVSVALLRQAYALYPEPNLLYNLARALESLGDAKGALEAYKNYLAANANLEDRGAIERRITTLEAEIAEKDKRDKRDQPVPPPPKQPPVEESRPSAMPVSPRAAPRASKLPLVVIGGGVALVGAGVVFGMQASDRRDRAIAEPGGLAAERLLDSARSRATLANVMFVAGGVAVLGGVVWAVSDRSSRRREVATVKIGPGSIRAELIW